MKIHNIYADEAGESHWRDLEIEFADVFPAYRKISAPIPLVHMTFRETDATYDIDWHPAPQRQYIINLEGGLIMTASDGETRTIGPGEVCLVEDTTGKGHLSTALNGEGRKSITIKAR